MKNSQVAPQIHSMRNNEMMNLGSSKIQMCTTFPIHPSSCHQRQLSHIQNNLRKNIGSSFVPNNLKGLQTQRVAFTPNNQKINELLKVAAPANNSVQQSQEQGKQKKNDRPQKDKRFFQWMQKPKKQVAPPKGKDQKEGYQNSKNSKQCPIVSDIRFLQTKKNPIESASKNPHTSIANLIQKETQNLNIIYNGNCEKIKSAVNIGVQIQKQLLSNKLNLVEAKRQEMLRDLTCQRETRGKKAIFKTPAFLLDKANVLPLTKTTKHNEKSFHSTPKTCRTQQQICFSKKISFQSKVPQCEIGRFQNGGSSQKNIRISSHRLNKKVSFFASSPKIPKVLDIGAQLKLKRVTNCSDLCYVELKVIKILADNEGSSTYLVVQKYTNFIYCLKKNEIKNKNEINQISNMIRQSKIGMFMQNSFLVKTHCTLFDEKNIYQLMEYAPASTLHSHNKKQRISKAWKKQLGNEENNGLHELGHIKQILFQLLEGVSYMHKIGITHRDLKPANIFLSNIHAFKIGDFGCSIFRSPEDYVGTLDYAAPQIMLHYDHGPAVDMWAIGCIAYELYTGQPPFFHPDRQETIERIVQCNYDITPINNNLLKDFILKLLIKDPIHRISSVQAKQHPLFASP